MNQFVYKTRSKSLIQTFAFLLFCLIIIVNPLPLGSNRDWAWSFMALIALVVCLLLLLSKDFTKQSKGYQRLVKMRLELSLMLAWLFVGALYLLPLPISLLTILSPEVAKAYSGLSLSYGYLTLDYYATYKTLLLSLYYFMVFVVGVALVTSRKRIKIILFIFFVIGVAESIYGMYLVSIGKTGLLVQVTTVRVGNASGTFINKNHFVAFLSLCFISGLALRLLISRKLHLLKHLDYRVRVVRFLSHPLRLFDFGLFLILAGLWNTHSRAGIASFILTLIFLAALLIYGSKITSKKINLNFKTLLLAVVSMIVLLIVIADDITYLVETLGGSQKESLDYVVKSAEGRMLAVQQVLQYYPKYWFSGVGPGAYQVFFVNHRSVEQLYYFDHAHNDYLEFLIEYGVFSLLLFAIVLIVSFRIVKMVLTTRSTFYKILSVCSISSVVYLLLHGSMDFNAHIPANIIAIIVVISIIYGKIVMFDVKYKR